MRSLFFFSFAIMIAACNQPQKTETTSAAFDMEAVKKHIAEMNKTYGNRFLSNDTAFYIERYCKDAEVYSPGVPAVKDRDSIRSFFYQNGNNKEAKIELPPNTIYGSESLVVEDGTYNFPDSRGGSFDKGKFIALWKQEDGKWKLYREIWNTDIATKR